MQVVPQLLLAFHQEDLRLPQVLDARIVIEALAQQHLLVQELRPEAVSEGQSRSQADLPVKVLPGLEVAKSTLVQALHLLSVGLDRTTEEAGIVDRDRHLAGSSWRRGAGTVTRLTPSRVDSRMGVKPHVAPPNTCSTAASGL